ncbi:hypothetical protein GCM10017783_17270 [Deinococcus piscis]|uniref:ORC1/DEAH AAA+ ATPase domain-containing protein n=1 Tax=Deinococcus piscis TaxID=394230 RepID=A0ABQ3K8Y5_9DEIO|nr:hypothetical protein GCM10017783_17270 [Deinococcus piscis]
MEQASEAKLIALMAPSGYGKTILLAQYARVSQRSCSWLSLSGEMADPLILARALAFSLQTTLPDLKLSRFERTLQDAAYSQDMAVALAEDLVDTPDNLRIILDQAQYLSKTSGEWLETFLECLPEGHQLLLGGYEGLPVNLSRLAFRDELMILGASQLAFTPQESTAYLSARGLEKEHEQLHDSLEGWPAGMALVSAQAKEYLSPAELIRGLIEQLPGEWRDRFNQVGPLSIWSEERARQIGADLPPGWLEYAARIGLPLAPLGQGDYKPHRLLLKELKKDLAKTPVAPALFAATGRLLEAEQDLYSALDAYRKAGACAEEHRVLYQLLFDLTQRSEHAVAAELLEPYAWQELPPQIQGLMMSIYSRLHRTAEVAEMVERLSQSGHDNPAVAKALAEWETDQGNYAVALQRAQQGLERPLLSGYDWTIRLHNAQLRALWLGGDIEQAWVQAQAGIQRIQSDDPVALAQLYHFAAIIAAVAWQPEAAVDYGRQAFQLYRDAGALHGMALVSWEVMNGLVLQGRYEEAWAAYREVQQVIGGHPHAFQWEQAHLLELVADLHLWNLELTEAAQTLETLALQTQPKRQDIYERASLKRYEVDLRLGTWSPQTDPWPAVGESDYGLLWRGMMLLLSGETEQARQSLEQAVDRLDGAELLRAQALLAEAELQEGREGASVQCVRELSAKLGGISLLQADMPYMPQLAQVLGGLGGGKAQPAPVRIPQAREPQGGHLKIMGDHFSLSFGGEEHTLSHKRGRELLILLATRGASSRDMLVDAMWDGDADPKNIDYFKVIVRRLRHQLSQILNTAEDPLPFRQGVYQLGSSMVWQTDYGELRQAVEQKDQEAVAALLEHCTNRFLESIGEEWAEELRLEIQDLIEEAALWISNEDESNTLGLEALVRLDSMNPMYYEGLIERLKKLEKSDKARIYYKKYLRMMVSEDLGKPQEYDLI